MKVRYIGKEKMNWISDDNDMDLVPQKIYEVVSEEKGFYRIVDESGEDYLYPPQYFEVVK